MQQILLKVAQRLTPNQKKFIAEVIGTFIVVVFATGSVVIDAKLKGALGIPFIAFAPFVGVAIGVEGCCIVERITGEKGVPPEAIRYVERFATDFDLLSLMHLEASRNSHIQSKAWRSNQRIPPHITDGTDVRLSERGGVQVVTNPTPVPIGSSKHLVYALRTNVGVQ